MVSNTPSEVENLYELTGITPTTGISDYTDGMYFGDPNTPHDVAQKNQHDYLLDEVGASEGFRLLEIGCGLGTLLERARDRGVIGTGITISRDQVRQCSAKGLDVRLINYKDSLPELKGSYDGIIANGSIEHFVQPTDVLKGNQDSIYEEMFQIFYDLLDPKTKDPKVATTVIHFNGKHIDPAKFIKSPFKQLNDSEGFHSAILHHGYGGYYPTEGQLESSARSKFELIKSVDGTEDYKWTSEYWCNIYRKAFFTNPKFIYQFSKNFFKRPLHSLYVAASYIGPKSWAWQFRKETPPAKLFRQTWIKK